MAARSRARRLLPLLTFVALGMILGARPPLPACPLAQLPLSPRRALIWFGAYATAVFLFSFGPGISMLGDFALMVWSMT